MTGKYRGSRKRMTSRGKYGRMARRQNFKARVRKIVNKMSETKYYDRELENHQLYHNLGSNVGGLVPVNVTAIPQFFNPWAFIAKNTDRFGRIGDKIQPRGMKLTLWLANKVDRPNTKIRIIIAILPKEVNGIITTAQFDPFQIANSGLNNNNLLKPPDTDVGVKFLYDKIITVGRDDVSNIDGPATKKERNNYLRLWIKRKRANEIVYNTGALAIKNKPLAIYALPYEQYSTLTTDNVASLAGYMRLYYKDL